MAGTNVRAVAGTNTDDVMKLFGGYGQGKTTADNPLSFIGGYGQPPSIADVIAQSIGVVKQNAAQSLLTPAVPTIGTPPFVPVAQTAGQIPVTPTVPGQISSSVPLPTLQGLPTPPSVMDVLNPPVYDEGRAQNENEKALRLANLVPALASILGIKTNAAQAMGPGLIASALAGADAGTKEREARRIKQYGLQQDAANLQDQRTQRRYGQDVDVTQESNKNAGTLYNAAESASRADSAEAVRRAAIEQKDTAAMRSSQARNYRSLITLESAGQEAALSAPGGEEKYGVPLKYDANGKFQPYRTQKDLTNQQNADSNTANSKANIERKQGQTYFEGKKLEGYLLRLEQQGKLTDAQVLHYQNQDENARKALDISAQRANTYAGMLTVAKERSAQSAARAMSSKGDPAKEAAALNKDISLARVRQSNAKKAKESGDLLPEDAQIQIDQEEDYIRATRTQRDAAADEAVKKGTLTEAQARAVKGLPPIYRSSGGDTRSMGSRYNESTAPVAAPTLTATQVRKVSKAGASRSTGTVGPAKVSVPKDAGYDDWLKRGKGLGVPVGK